MRGPKPAYQPQFPPDFVAHAKEVLRRTTAAHQLWQRAKLVLLLVEERGISNAEVAQRVGLHANTVRRWRRRWAQGNFDLDDTPGNNRGQYPYRAPDTPTSEDIQRASDPG
ncbi:MAG TPA: helix-turn-helix domain-containing protein [Pirellulales bacterium]|nr:helix-turn-helix domain-containing protein [Pirellulales bacterium]